MIYYDEYGAPDPVIDAFVAETHLGRLVTASPEGGYRPVTTAEPMYRGMLGLLVAVRLEVRARRAKFKLGQNRPPEVRAKVARELRDRARPSDSRAADALLWTIEREA